MSGGESGMFFGMLMLSRKQKQALLVCACSTKQS